MCFADVTMKMPPNDVCAYVYHANKFMQVQMSCLQAGSTAAADRKRLDLRNAWLLREPRCWKNAFVLRKGKPDLIRANRTKKRRRSKQQDGGHCTLHRLRRSLPCILEFTCSLQQQRG